MSKMLSKEEIDKILGVDQKERVPTNTEIRQIVAAIETVANERNISVDKISNSEINEIVKSIGIKNVKIYSLDEILKKGK